MTKLHASCAARQGSGVLLLGPAGSGKSDLLLRLIDRGFVLVADDQVEIDDGWARPAGGLEGVVEMRGLGLLRLPWRSPVRLALACQLQPSVARLPEPELHALGLPLLRLDPRPASAPLLVDHALDCATGRASLLAGAFG